MLLAVLQVRFTKQLQHTTMLHKEVVAFVTERAVFVVLHLMLPYFGKETYAIAAQMISHARLAGVWDAKIKIFVKRAVHPVQKLCAVIATRSRALMMAVATARATVPVLS